MNEYAGNVFAQGANDGISPQACALAASGCFADFTVCGADVGACVANIGVCGANAGFCLGNYTDCGANSGNCYGNSRCTSD